MLFDPDVEIGHRDRVTHDGVTYEVVGAPHYVRWPGTQEIHRIDVDLRVVV